MRRCVEVLDPLAVCIKLAKRAECDRLLNRAQSSTMISPTYMRPLRAGRAMPAAILQRRGGGGAGAERDCCFIEGFVWLYDVRIPCAWVREQQGRMTKHTGEFEKYNLIRYICYMPAYSPSALHSC